jgi:hypothetical protein
MVAVFHVVYRRSHKYEMYINSFSLGSSCEYPKVGMIVVNC